MDMFSLFAILFVILCVFQRGLGRRLYLASKIQGPSLWKLFLVHGKNLLGKDMLNYMCELCETYEHKPWGFWMYGDYTVVVSDPKSVGEVFRSKNMHNKPIILYENLTKYFGYGLFSLNGSEYRRHRRRIEPVYRKRFLESCLLPPINDSAKKLVDRLHQKDVDVMNSVEDAAIELSFLTLTSGMYQYSDNRHLWKTSQAALSLVQLKSVNPVYYWCWYKWKGSTRRCEVAVNALYAELRNVFLQVKDSVMNKQGEFSSNPMASMLGNSEEEFTDDELFAEFKTLITSVFETTSFTINVCLALLALYPDVQQRVFEELESIFGQDRDRPVEPQDLSSMVYMDTVIKETLRLFPPGPMIGRKADGETVIDGVAVPKGSTVLVNIMALHRNKNVYKDPLKFDPDRLLLQPFSFLPFSFGSRGCPGQHQAFIVIKTILCFVVKNFKLLPSESLKSLSDIKVKMAISMHLSKSIPLRLVRRRVGY